MKIRFLGTAAAEGAPAIFCKCPHCEYARKAKGKEIRTRSGAIIDGLLKLDFGPDSYRQMLDNDLNYADVHSVLITHSHEDHFLPTDIAFRRDGFSHLPENDPPMTVYGNAKVGSMLAEHACDEVKFREMTPFVPVEIEGYTVTPLQAVHCRTDKAETFPVTFEDETVYRSEDALFYLIEKDGHSILYAHDTDEFTPEDMAFLKGKKIDLISLDCTNAAYQAEYVGHMGAADNLRMRDKLLAAGAADAHTVFVANHFSHNGLVPHEQLEKLMPGFTVAYDGLEISL